jgi:hypothetical protein
MRVPATGWLLVWAVLAALGLAVGARAQGDADANVQSQNFDVTIPRAFTSPDNGQTRCFVGIGCIGVPAGGWAWRLQDIGGFDASAPRPPFDPNHPEPYWSPDTCCTASSIAVPDWQARYGTRCFVGYGCFGPPPGGWQWTDEDIGPVPQADQSLPARPVPLSSADILSVIKTALQHGLQFPISLPLSGVESSITIAQFLQTVSDANKRILDDDIRGWCGPSKMCSAAQLTQAADDVSNIPFMGVTNIKSGLSVSAMSQQQYQSFIQDVVTTRAKQLGYAVD